MEGNSCENQKQFEKTRCSFCSVCRCCEFLETRTKEPSHVNWNQKGKRMSRLVEQSTSKSRLMATADMESCDQSIWGQKCSFLCWQWRRKVLEDAVDENTLIHRDDEYNTLSTTRMSTNNDRRTQICDFLVIKINFQVCPKNKFTIATIDNKTRAFGPAKQAISSLSRAIWDLIIPSNLSVKAMMIGKA